MDRRKMVGVVAALSMFVCIWSTVHAESWHGIGITTDLAWDSGDYGGGDTINTYSGTINIEYSVTSRLSLSLSIVPYIYQNETYTDVVLVMGRVVHYKDRHGTNPHHDKDATYIQDDSSYGSTQTDSESGNQESSYQENDSGMPHHDESSHDTQTDTESDTSSDMHDATRGENTEETKTGHMAVRALQSISDGSESDAGESGKTKRKRDKRHGSAGGFGDMTLNASYFILDESELLPHVAVKAGVKFPTADEDKGLGTGEFDYLFGMDMTKNIGGWSLFGGVSYNILGDPDYYDLNNYVSGYVGVSSEVLPNFYASVELDASGAASDESDSEFSLGLELGYDFGTPGYLAAGVAKGLSDGSPDFSLYMSYSIGF